MSKDSPSLGKCIVCEKDVFGGVSVEKGKLVLDYDNVVSVVREGVPAVRHANCGPGSIEHLKKYGITEYTKYLYRNKGGEKMEQGSCSGFGKLWSVNAKECIACGIILPEYAGACKVKCNQGCPFGRKFELDNSDCLSCGEDNSDLYNNCKEKSTKGGVKKMPNLKKETVEGAVTEKKQSNVEYCAELIASGLSKEEVYKAIAKKYTDVGKDEVFATKRAKSIYATTVKLATVEPVTTASTAVEISPNDGISDMLELNG